MQGALPEVRSRGEVRFSGMERAVADGFHLRWLTTLRACVHVMVGTGRLAFELPQILKLLKVGNCFGIPLLSFLGWKLGGAYIHGNFAAQPEIRAAGNMDGAYGKVGAWWRELAIAGLERSDAAKLAKIGLACVQNILETPASAVLLVLTLRGCRNSEKSRTNKRKKPQHFCVHDVPAPQLRHTCAVGEDRAGSAQAAASAYFNDSSYVRTNLLLVNKQMAWRARGLPTS